MYRTVYTKVSEKGSGKNYIWHTTTHHMYLWLPHTDYSPYYTSVDKERGCFTQGPSCSVNFFQISKASFSDGLHSIDSIPLLQVLWMINPLLCSMSITDLHKIQTSYQTTVCQGQQTRWLTMNNPLSQKSFCSDCSYV